MLRQYTAALTSCGCRSAHCTMAGRTQPWVRDPSQLTVGKRVLVPAGSGVPTFPIKEAEVDTVCEIVDSSGYNPKSRPDGKVLVKAIGAKHTVPSGRHWILPEQISLILSDEDDGNTPMDQSGESEQDEGREDDELAAMSENPGPTDARAERLAARRATQAAEESSDEARGDHLMNPGTDGLEACRRCRRRPPTAPGRSAIREDYWPSSPYS